MNNAKVVIKNLNLIPSGTYPEQYNYQYALNLNSESMMALFESVLHGDGTLNHNCIATGMSDLLSLVPSEHPVKIAHGWGHQRLFFSMLLETTFPTTNSKLHQFVQGYTDHAPVSLTEGIGQDVEFTVNSVITYRETEARTPSGIEKYETVVDASNILLSAGLSGAWAHDVPDERPSLARPEDIFARMSLRNIQDMMGSAQIVDTRTQFIRAIKSTAMNDLPSHYAARVLETYRNSTIANLDNMHGDQQVLDFARGMVQEHLMSRDMLFRGVAEVSTLPISNIFTFKNLLQLQPDLVPTMVQSSVPIHHVVTEPQPEVNAVATVKCHLISNIVTGLMRELGFIEMRLTANNTAPDGQVHLNIVSFKSLFESSKTALDAFVIRLGAELDAFVSFNSMLGYAATVMANLTSESIVTLDLGAEEYVEIVIPIAFSGMLSPVVLERTSQATALMEGFEVLINEMTNR